MPVPSQAQLEERQKQAQDKLRRIKQAYDDFVTEFDAIEKEEKTVITELQGYMKKSKLHDILHTIHSIKDQ